MYKINILKIFFLFNELYISSLIFCFLAMWSFNFTKSFLSKKELEGKSLKIISFFIFFFNHIYTKFRINIKSYVF